MHRVPEMQARTTVEIARLEAALEQQGSGRASRELANPFGFVDIEQREAIGALQGGVDVADTVTVGVRLDDGPDLGACPPSSTGDREVGRESVEMDERFDRPRHGRILPAR